MIECKCKLFIRFVLIVLSLSSITYAEYADDKYYEELVIKPLATGHLYAYFQLTTYWNVEITDQQSFAHFNLFPKPLGQILNRYDVEELHFSLTQGLWRYDWWGYPVISTPPGAELIAWFSPNATQGVDTAWSGLTNALSGLFCTSLNFIDSRTTVNPMWNFRPEGASSEKKLNVSRLRYATLTRETVCTENLTPWKKLLPCAGKTGLSALFNSLALYNSYHSIGIHVRPLCKANNCSTPIVELKQTLSLVFNPIHLTGGRDWSFRSLFSKTIPSTCPLATTSKVYVDIYNNKTFGSFILNPSPHSVAQPHEGSSELYAVYDLDQIDFSKKYAVNGFDLEAEWITNEKYGRASLPPLRTHRYVSGIGDENGGIRTIIFNDDNHDITVLYMEVIPWYFRLYLHTFNLTCNVNSSYDVMLNRRYVPGKDRSRPYLLELALKLPSKSHTTIKIDFERAFLKWTEHPPDAHHGLYIGSAILTTILPRSTNLTNPPLITQNTNYGEDKVTRIYTEALLVTLPTPDFSMPFIVICLTSTVVAIAFGSIHNLTTKQYETVTIENVKKKGLLTSLISKVRSIFAR